MLSWERQRRLQEKYNYLLEMERVRNFSWDEWRKRVSKLKFELKFFGHIGKVTPVYVLESCLEDSVKKREIYSPAKAVFKKLDHSEPR